MLVDIFSSFDDHNRVFMSMYPLMWVLALCFIFSFSTSLWLGNPRWTEIFFLVKETISSQVLRSFGNTLGGFMGLISSLFMLLILMNLIGLVPYVFSSTSHLVISFSLGLPLWLSLIISGILFSPSSAAAALLPAGAPILLNPFLILIETVSIVVRPITLSVRLMANISAGHIVLALIGSYLTTSIFYFSFFNTFILLMLQVFYVIFELGVSVIQAYIFCLLITLYSDEHPH